MSFVQKIHLTGVLIFFFFHFIFAQNGINDTIPPPPPAPVPPTNCIEPEPFHVIETMPLFPGCQDTTLINYAEKKQCADKALLQYIFKNLSLAELPEDADPGTIVVGFTVKMDGAIANVEVVRSNGPFIDKKVVELIEQMPNWEPGTQRGRPVQVKYYLPLRICLE